MSSSSNTIPLPQSSGGISDVILKMLRDSVTPELLGPIWAQYEQIMSKLEEAIRNQDTEAFVDALTVIGNHIATKARDYKYGQAIVEDFLWDCALHSNGAAMAMKLKAEYHKIIKSMARSAQELEQPSGTVHISSREASEETISPEEDHALSLILKRLQLDGQTAITAQDTKPSEGDDMSRDLWRRICKPTYEYAFSKLLASNHQGKIKTLRSAFAIAQLPASPNTDGRFTARHVIEAVRVAAKNSPAGFSDHNIVDDIWQIICDDMSKLDDSSFDTSCTVLQAQLLVGLLDHQESETDKIMVFAIACQHMIKLKRPEALEITSYRERREMGDLQVKMMMYLLKRCPSPSQPPLPTHNEAAGKEASYPKAPIAMSNQTAAQVPVHSENKAPQPARDQTPLAERLLNLFEGPSDHTPEPDSKPPTPAQHPKPTRKIKPLNKNRRG